MCFYSMNQICDVADFDYKQKKKKSYNKLLVVKRNDTPHK